MDLQAVREAIAAGSVRVRISSHARVEALKEGFTVADIRHAIACGEVVEEYLGRSRVLLLTFAAETGLPMHLVLEFLEGDSWATVATVYLPDEKSWYPGYRTRR